MDQSYEKSTKLPDMKGVRTTFQQTTVYFFVIVPSAALVYAMFYWGISLVNVLLMVAFYYVTGLGIAAGYHRLFTHASFRANRPLKIALAIAGNMAVQGPVIRWVSDHRVHHLFSDIPGDPHSPWKYGTSPVAVARGMGHAHLGWLFNRKNTNEEKYARNLLKDPDIVRIDRLFPLWTALTLLLPALLGGLITWSWAGALSAFLWAGLARVAVLHHVTWSVNSICHVIDERPFNSNDRAANVWWLAIFSFGESWHNLHHADPTSARHGVLPGQIDIAARLIWLFEKFGWAKNVRWPSKERVEGLRRSV